MLEAVIQNLTDFFKEIKSYGTKDFIADKCVVGTIVEGDFNNGISNYETDTD